MSGILAPIIFVLSMTLVFQLVFTMNGDKSNKISDNNDSNINRIDSMVSEKNKIKISDVLESPLGKNIVKFSKNATCCEIVWQKSIKSDNIIGELKKFDDVGMNIKKLNIKSDNFNVIIEIEGDFWVEE